MSLRLYEYEVKNIFKEAGIPVPEGDVVSTPERAAQVAERLGGTVAIKAQALTGGRGKNGAIAFADSPAQAEAVATRLLRMEVNDWPVHEVLVEKRLEIEREFYVAATFDTFGNVPVLIASSQGGIEIEQVAAQSPEQFQIEPVDIFRGPGQYQARNLFSGFGFSGKQLLRTSNIALKLYDVFSRHYARLVEINPLALTTEGQLVAVDAKLDIDVNATQFMDNFAKTRERYRSYQEYEAAQHGLTYIKLDGDIGVACTGAGLTLATLDIIRACGGSPANFLEFGGATYGNAYYALRIILSDPDVKVMLINTFGLVARADVIAEGLVDAIRALKPEVPIVAAVRGTGEDKARELLWESVGVKSLSTTQEVVEAAIEIAEGKV